MSIKKGASTESSIYLNSIYYSYIKNKSEPDKHNSYDQTEKFGYFIKLLNRFDEIQREPAYSSIAASSLASFSDYSQFSTNDESKKNFYNVVRAIYSKLKHEKKSPQSVSTISTNIKLIVNFNTLGLITDMLILGLSSFIGKWEGNKKLNMLIFTGEKTWADLSSNEVSEFFENIKTTKSIEIKLGTIGDDLGKFSLDRVLLFYLFYPYIFPNTLGTNFDFNINKLNKYYLKEKYIRNLYNTNSETPILNLMKKYQKIFVSNFLFSQKMTEASKQMDIFLELEQYDSYIVEVAEILKTELGIKNMDPEDLNLIFYKNILQVRALFHLAVHINALDTVLFKNIMFILFQSINNSSTMQKLEIDLFADDLNRQTINIRKMFLNFMFFKKKAIKDYEEYFDKEYNFKYNDTFNWNNQRKDTFPISEEKILDILYEEFKENLIYLIILLEKNSQCAHLNLVMNLPQILKKQTSYTSAIYYFIYNFFLMLNRKSFQIRMNFLKLKSNIMPTNFLLKSLSKINIAEACIFQNLSLKIHKISRIINFETFPFSSVESLKLSNFCFADLIELTKAFRKLKIEKMREIIIKMMQEIEINMQAIYDFFSEGAINSLSDIKFSMLNDLNPEEYLGVMKSVIKGLNKNTKLPKYSNICINLYCSLDDKELLFSSIKEEIESCFTIDNLNEEMLTSYHFHDYSTNKLKTIRSVEIEITKLRLDEEATKCFKMVEEMHTFPSNDYAMKAVTEILGFVRDSVQNIKVIFIFSVPE